MQVQNLPAMLIAAPSQIRPVDRKQAQALAASIREIGLLTPLIVKPGVRVRNGSEVPGWDILAGNHRFEALFRILNWTEIPCIVMDEDNLKAELTTIDENLVRRELSDAERAYQTARRKKIYEALHPETRQGAFNQHTSASGQFGHLQTERFTAATAKAIGRGERTVRREAERGQRLGETLNRIKGTSLDRGVEIDALAALPHQEREHLVARAESGERVSARKTAESPSSIVAIDTQEMQANTIGRRLMREYLDAPRKAQKVFDDLYAEVSGRSAEIG